MRNTFDHIGSCAGDGGQSCQQMSDISCGLLVMCRTHLAADTLWLCRTYLPGTGPTNVELSLVRRLHYSDLHNKVGLPASGSTTNFTT